QGKRCVVEATCVLLACLLFVCWLGWMAPSNRFFILNRTFALSLPLLIWAALRTDVFVMALVAMMISGLAIFETAHGRGPFATLSFPMSQLVSAMPLAVAAWG